MRSGVVIVDIYDTFSNMVVMMRSESDSFLCVQNRARNNSRRKLISRIISILHLDKCVSYNHASSILTCAHCVSPDLRPRTMEDTDRREIDKPRSPRCTRSAGLHQHRHLESPKTILDVDYNILQSGVAILPGMCLVNAYYIHIEIYIYTYSQTVISSQLEVYRRSS